MNTLRILLSSFAFFFVSALSAGLLPPPPYYTSNAKVKALYDEYVRLATLPPTPTNDAELAALRAEIVSLKDVRTEVLEWARGQAITKSAKFAISASGDMTLTWEHAGTGTIPIAFRIYRSGDGVNFSSIATTTEKHYIDRGLIVGATYWYFVTAFNPAGETGPSNTANKIAD